jgi:hypothetical protein
VAAEVGPTLPLVPRRHRRIVATESFRVKRRFNFPRPLEYREAGGPPASWFIDDLMRFLGQPYYVGLLSAAAIHGAAHQQPMVFQGRVVICLGAVRLG